MSQQVKGANPVASVRSVWQAVCEKQQPQKALRVYTRCALNANVTADELKERSARSTVGWAVGAESRRPG
jgi:invasion protein IalB